MTERQKNRIRELGLHEEDFWPAVISGDDILEILAEQEFRICLLELGVNEDDL